MQTLTQYLIDQGLRDRFLTEEQLARVAGGEPGRRYGLVNRALKAEELVRIRRGLYTLAARYRTDPAHPFAMAQALVPGSYVSFETALSHHGWIPEGVRVVASVVPGRKSSTVEHPLFGRLAFHPLALVPDRFLELIEREELGRQVALVAKPLRALMDLVCLRKIEWQGMGWLTEGMRIDRELLQEVPGTEMETLREVYQQQRPRRFLAWLAAELGRD